MYKGGRRNVSHQTKRPMCKRTNYGDEPSKLQAALYHRLRSKVKLPVNPTIHNFILCMGNYEKMIPLLTMAGNALSP